MKAKSGENTPLRLALNNVTNKYKKLEQEQLTQRQINNNSINEMYSNQKGAGLSFDKRNQETTQRHVIRQNYELSVN